jgi:hypothetical protein
MKHCMQGSELEILVENREMLNAKSTNFIVVITDGNLSCKIYIESTCTIVIK